MRTYKATYENFNNGQWTTFTNLNEAKSIITQVLEKSWDNYYTVWIYEYNSIGRHCASYYLSIKDKKWHMIKVSPLSYSSWREANSVIKFLVLPFFYLFGLKKYEEEKIQRTINLNKRK